MIDVAAALRLLCEQEVAFAIIGGYALTAHGSAFVTNDLDIAYSREAPNLERLAEALRQISARLRLSTNENPIEIPLDAKFLFNGMNFTFETDLGDIDILGEVAGVGKYEAVLALSQTEELFGLRIYVLSLEGLLAAKRAAGRPKDLLTIPEIEAMLEWKARENG